MKFNQIAQYRFPNGHYIKVESNHDVWVIGDVHGCAREFENLCTRIHNLNPHAIIIQLGDLIDRGPYLKEVFDVVDKHQVICTIGNHELNFILEHEQYKRCGSMARKENHQRLAAYQSTNIQNRVLTAMKRMYNYVIVDIADDIENERWFLSHAPIRGYEQAWPEQGITAKNGWTYCARTDPYDESYFHALDRAAHGHQHWNYIDINQQLNQMFNGDRRVLNVDGGCVYGGELVAANLLTHETIRIQPYETYFTE